MSGLATTPSHTQKCGGKGEKNSGSKSKGNAGLLNGAGYHLDESCTGRCVKLLGCAVKSQIPKRFCEEIEVSNLYTLLTGKSTSVKYSHLKGKGKLYLFGCQSIHKHH